MILFEVIRIVYLHLKKDAMASKQHSLNRRLVNLQEKKIVAKRKYDALVERLEADNINVHIR